MRILGIDPGFAITGWGLIEKQGSVRAILSHGVITTPQDMDFEKRLVILNQEISTLLNTHKPHACAIEKLFFAKNTKTALDVAQARGVILVAIALKNIPLASYGPLTVKQTITGDGNADKKQMQAMVVKILKLTSIPKPDDVADAIAIALTHSYMVKNSI
jgi:crossover junction endodeoxyribonuclease RuvC